MMSKIAGKRILLVEDEFLIAEMTSAMLSDLGVIVIGPAHTLAKGLALAIACDCDAALLDVNLGRERSDAIAETLKSRGIPFVSTSGSPSSEGIWHGAPALDKPYMQSDLATVLEGVFGG